MPKPLRPADNFLSWVQTHERAWGTQTYAGRPTLEQILASPVVVFWQRSAADAKSDKHYVVTLHDNLSTLEKYFARQLMFSHAETARNRVIAIFDDRRQMQIVGVRIQFAPVNSQSE
jgi:hypothetical protein